MVRSLRADAVLSAGVDHPSYRHEVRVSQAARQTLLQDLA
jgi:hypothetical protein